MPYESAWAGNPAYYSVKEWNEKAPEKLHFKNTRGTCLVGMGPPSVFGRELVQFLKEKGYKAQCGNMADMDSHKEVFCIHLTLPAEPAHWIERPLSPKLRKALGWEDYLEKSPSPRP